MTLTKCPECEKQVSDKAPQCPNCGYPVSNNTDDNPPKSSNVLTWGISIVIFAFLTLLGTTGVARALSVSGPLIRGVPLTIRIVLEYLIIFALVRWIIKKVTKSEKEEPGNRY